MCHFKSQCYRAQTLMTVSHRRWIIYQSNLTTYDIFLKNKITIQQSLLVYRLHLGQCGVPLFLSTQTIYLHTVKARSNVIGQY